MRFISSTTRIINIKNAFFCLFQIHSPNRYFFVCYFNGIPVQGLHMTHGYRIRSMYPNKIRGRQLLGYRG